MCASLETIHFIFSLEWRKYMCAMGQMWMPEDSFGSDTNVHVFPRYRQSMIGASWKPPL